MMNSSNEQILLEVSSEWDFAAAVGVGLDGNITW